jgi:hypothetical protein
MMAKATYVQTLEQDTLASCGALDQEVLCEFGRKYAEREYFMFEKKRQRVYLENERKAEAAFNLMVAKLDAEMNPKEPIAVIQTTEKIKLPKPERTKTSYRSSSFDPIGHMVKNFVALTIILTAILFALVPPEQAIKVIGSTASFFGDVAKGAGAPFTTPEKFINNSEGMLGQMAHDFEQGFKDGQAVARGVESSHEYRSLGGR